MASPTSLQPSSLGSSATGAARDSIGFRYPPIHAFPPFYTLQPNPVSRGQQLSQWRTLILDYCRCHRIFSLSPLPATSDGVVSEEAADPHKSLFANKSIQRSLSPESIRQVLADLVEHKQAAWEEQLTSKAKSTASVGANAKAFIYWKSPAQWADAIYQWVLQTGQNKSIMTLFELNQGDLVQEFYELPLPMLKQALKHLSSQGKAQIFAGTEADDGQGVKFV
ncbi:hypothetical protein NDA11_005813 [Ustilago hordei]|uniref:ESCRT-II complex subunit VPS25 n=1 Tax=Ustilago hordei TaxID=120017 RepID=I2FMS4_USTHO|nr:uncharacterized protein UHO2_04819 [Ustilago hordei]KAJ1041875.1 hypothetical protein NDA10_000609 [Ustilago hordei]KAJ1575561.1 hypothetical protein NDA15_006189 [Ustilago hordei]KAJ1577343.1 hypothetical protein NDA12_006500 [Ustilago hordei]KAJ1595224.1 hypothetical protein NDA11_005813 [Ustilago hordei]KAJ1597154.1 hypothetical protein NDA14_007366 [Ustilago hordei]